MLNHFFFFFFFFFLRLGLGQRRAVVIIGRWLLPSLVDTGDICCHYWQHILVSQQYFSHQPLKLAFLKIHSKIPGVSGSNGGTCTMLNTGNPFLPVCLSVHVFGSMYTDRSAVFHMALVLHFRLFQQIPWLCSISSHSAMANIWAWRKRICLSHQTFHWLDAQQIGSRIFYRHPHLWIRVLWFK